MGNITSPTSVFHATQLSPLLESEATSLIHVSALSSSESFFNSLQWLSRSCPHLVSKLNNDRRCRRLEDVLPLGFDYCYSALLAGLLCDGLPNTLSPQCTNS